MFMVVNVILVAAVFMLILVIAARSSIPSRQASGLNSPEDDCPGPASLPNQRKLQQLGSGRVTLQRQVAAAGMQ